MVGKLGGDASSEWSAAEVREGGSAGGVDGVDGLPTAEVELCVAHLHRFPADLGALESRLPADEQQRAVGIRAENRRRQFVVGRVVLREMLARHLGADAEAAPFRYLPIGKPVLDLSEPTINFNVAHSGDLVVVAICRSELVGIDVERIRPVPHLARIARTYFTEGERHWLESLDEQRRSEGFMRLWTAKEATVKATGRGISAGWTSYEVRIDAGTTISVCSAEEPSTVWHLLEPAVSADYILSVAVPRRGMSARTFQWHLDDHSR